MKAKSRRNFLKNIGLTAGGMSLISLFGFESKVEKEYFERKINNDIPFGLIRVKGQVVCEGKGVSNVSVTDGCRVERTDKNGYFNLLSHTARDFVYISMPSGYEIERQSNGSALFFKRLDKRKEENKMLFELKLLKQSDLNHHFLLLADTQIQNEFEAKQLLEVSTPDLIKTIKEINDPNIFGIGCGDLVHDELELFSSYNQSIKNMNIPFFQVIGNHDMDLNVRTDEMTTSTFNNLFGPTYYSYNRGEIHYVVLDDVFFIGLGKKYIGYLTEEQLSWLESDLKYVEKGSTVVVSLHIPTITGASKRYPDRDPIATTVNNREYLYSILSPFNAHIMSGHTHFNDNIQISNNLYEHCHGTVCGAWWSGPICYDGTPNGYGVYKAEGSSLSWYYKGTNLDKEKQFRVYKKGEHPDYPELWSVNIWNWDAKWQVYWYEDGIRKGELSRVIAKDPMSIVLHEGPEKPERRKWVEPQLSDHMFFFEPGKTSKNIVIETIDGFGRIYSETFVVG